jgi:hypothetical protein
MRHCNLFDPLVLGRMTLREYALRMKAVQLQKLDRERELYWQAWLTQQAQATKKQGKEIVPYFRDFDAFFDYEQRQAEILGTAKKPRGKQYQAKDPRKLAALMAKANS